MNVSVANASPPDVVQIWRLVDSARRCRDDGAVTAGARAGAEDDHFLYRLCDCAAHPGTHPHRRPDLDLDPVSPALPCRGFALGRHPKPVAALRLQIVHLRRRRDSGVRPSLGRRLVIQAISPEDDARRALMTKAIAIAEQRRRPRSGKVRLRLRMSARMGQGSGMSLALQQTRWFTAPVLGARFR